MQKCSNCSAPLQDIVEQCTFCGTTTQRGMEARQARALQTDAERRAAEQRSAADGARARATAQLDVDAAGKWALISSLVGSVVCCLVPVGPVLGIVFGLRARRLAQQHGLAGASLGTAGLTFGGLGVGLALLSWLGIGVMVFKENQRKAELKAQLGDLSSPRLELGAACALTELEMFETRYEEFGVTNDFDCPATGDLEVMGDEAILRDLRFLSGEKKTELVACLRFKNRWSVHQLRSDDDCKAPKEPPKKKKK